MKCDCYGVLCTALVYGLILFVDGSMYFTELILFEATTYLYIVLFNLLLIMVIWSHLQAMLSNPGEVPANYKQLDPELLPLSLTTLIEKVSRGSENFVDATVDFAPAGAVQVKVESTQEQEEKRVINSLLRFCRKCNSLKPPKTHHCRVCNRCIVRMDHHCPWISNCVGYYNQRPFILFLIYLVLASSYAFIIFGKNFFPVLIPGRVPVVEVEPKYVTLMGVNIALILVFWMFAVCMIGDQLIAIRTSLSIIDRKQGNTFEKKSITGGLMAVFGNTPGISWLIPTVKRKKLIVEKEYKALSKRLSNKCAQL